MKRLVLCWVAFGICTVSAALADDNVRAAQARLKEGGFYYGEVNGVSSSETSAALTRYQIRNGLQISGRLDPTTAKALGVGASTTETARAPEAETWQRLRRTDQQFLTDLSARKNATPLQPGASDAVPPASQVPESDADGPQRFTVSRERLRDYVAAFVLAGLDPSVDAELGFFGDRVSYFDQGIVDREKLRSDLVRYNQRWPQRQFWLAGEVRVEPRPDSRLRVTYPMRFELRNGARHSTGKVQKTLIVEVTGEDLQIVGVNERRAH